MHHEDEEFGHWKATYSVFRDLEVLKQVLCIVHKNNIILLTKMLAGVYLIKFFKICNWQILFWYSHVIEYVLAKQHILYW